MNPAIKVEAAAAVQQGDSYFVACRVDATGLPESLWFRVPLDYARHVALERADWALVSMLLPAMCQGRDLELAFPVSEKLHYALVEDLQYVLCQQDPRLKPIEIRAQALNRNLECATESAVGTGFSGGVDSFFTVAGHVAENQHPAHRLSHLVVNNVGALGIGEESRLSFDASCTRAADYAAEVGLQCVCIDSNLADFYADSFTFQQTHTLRNSAAVLLLQGLFTRYYYSSTFIYSDYFVGPSYDSAYADPTILGLLSTEHTEFISAGSGFSRLQKVRRVAEFPDSYKLLNVCVVDHAQRAEDNWLNCSECWKCARQLYTLELLARLELYADCFDLDFYRARRAEIVGGFWIRAIAKGDPINLEVLNLAVETGNMSRRRAQCLTLAIKLLPRLLSWRVVKKLV